MKHVLVVDDSEAIAYLFRRYFERYGYRASIAHNGKIAMQIARCDPIDGLVTDFRMKDMNGEELVLRLREMNAALPVIFVSAFTPDIGVEDQKTKVFSKPMEPVQIVHRMADMLSPTDSGTSCRKADSL